MAMTRKDMARVAEGFLYVAQDPSADFNTVRKMVYEFCNAARTINPRFDERKFCNAAGVPVPEHLRPALSSCPWYDVSEMKRPWWARGDCAGRMIESASGLICERHFNAQP